MEMDRQRTDVEKRLGLYVSVCYIPEGSIECLV